MFQRCAQCALVNHKGVSPSEQCPSFLPLSPTCKNRGRPEALLGMVRAKPPDAGALSASFRGAGTQFLGCEMARALDYFPPTPAPAPIKWGKRWASTLHTVKRRSRVRYQYTGYCSLSRGLQGLEGMAKEQTESERGPRAIRDHPPLPFPLEHLALFQWQQG